MYKQFFSEQFENWGLKLSIVLLFVAWLMIIGGLIN